MTVCFVKQYGVLCMVAADTRLSIDVGGTELARQDIGDLTVNDQFGNTLVVPYKYRKIRPVGRGWAASAGTFITGSHMLDALQAAQAFEPELAVRTIRAATPAYVAEFAQANGDAIYTAPIMGVAVADNGEGAWLAELHPETGYSLTQTRDFFSNWPKSIPDLFQPSFDTFSEALENAKNIGDAVRAAAAFIGAARACPGCGPHVQIGFTVHENPDKFRMGYIEGAVDDIIEMSTEVIRSKIENPQERPVRQDVPHSTI